MRSSSDKYKHLRSSLNTSSDTSSSSASTSSREPGCSCSACRRQKKKDGSYAAARLPNREGRYQHALACISRAQAFAKEGNTTRAKEQHGYAIGMLNRLLSELEWSNRMLPLYTDACMTLSECHSDLSQLYESQGLVLAAIEEGNRTVDVLRKLDFLGGPSLNANYFRAVARHLFGVSALHYSLGEKNAALDSAVEGLVTLKALDKPLRSGLDHRLQAQSCLYIGKVQEELNNSQEARQFYRKGTIALKRIPNHERCPQDFQKLIILYEKLAAIYSLKGDTHNEKKCLLAAAQFRLEMKEPSSLFTQSLFARHRGQSSSSSPSAPSNADDKPRNLGLS